MQTGFQQLFVENVDSVWFNIQACFKKKRPGIPAFSF